uniref:Gem-associated protein 2 n=1 Tax=Albugo laibachii Nc14 TaxID=890382 RepID=F0WKZ2_9STRA|nr:conserved hypothetical protein [Albugo laibachii Nc14]|eukprot:CCA21951.1 conserved hypothetical protein [Albugo laibachii Nc14]
MNAVLPIDEDGIDQEYFIKRMEDRLPPADVQEYLWRVCFEAEEIPEVVVSDVNPRDYDKRQTTCLPVLKDCCSVSDPTHLPSEQWKSYLLAEFAEVRQLIKRWQAIRSQEINTEERAQVPRQSDEAGWMRFFYGRDLDAQEDATMEIDEESSADNTEYNGSPPYLRLALQFDQILTRKLLMYQVEWLETLQLTKEHALWIFALLARLDRPTSADVSAIIRQLLRRCWKLRNELNGEDDTHLKCLNAIICISGEYFGQYSDVEDKAVVG